MMMMMMIYIYIYIYIYILSFPKKGYRDITMNDRGKTLISLAAIIL